jgi:DNA-binding transcriptional LysR family regulator
MTPRTVPFTPRCVVNSMRAAVASAVEGRGVTRLFSYQVAEYVRDDRLRIVLRSHEYAPVPVHLIMPEGRLSAPKIRAFVDLTVPRLRTQFARLALDGEGLESGRTTAQRLANRCALELAEAS